MKQLKKLLVVIEPDQSAQPALEKATMLAKLADCELELIMSEYNAFLEDGYYYDPAQAKQLRYEHGNNRLAELEALAQPLRSQGLLVNVSVAWENPPYKGIVSRAQTTATSMVIKSTRKHGKLARYFMSNEDWELVRYCPVPLLLVKAEAWRSEPLIVASLDPQSLNDKPAELDVKLLDASEALASISGGSVRLFHSSHKPSLAGLYPLDEDAGRSEQVLFNLAQARGLSTTDCYCDEDAILKSLPNYVESNGVSLVVMGAISRSRLDRIMIGSTAERLLDELDCDICVIKPDHIPALSQVLL
ncbi:MAG: universal stress protein [Pseudohongiellaceae bacterium]